MQQQSENDSRQGTSVCLVDLPYGRDRSDFEEVKEAIKAAFQQPLSDKIADIKVLDKLQKQNSFSAYAVVRFHNAAAAQEALDRKTLDIRRKAVRIEKYSDDKEYHIYIKDVKNLSKQQLEKHFQQYGKIDAIQKYSAEEHSSCLLRFMKAEDAENCLKLHQQNVEGTRIWLDRYISKEQRHDQFFRLFLRKIPASLDNKGEIQNLLRDEFSKFGKLVRKVDIEFKETQIKEGHAIIYYSTQEEAEAARLGFNMKLLEKYGNNTLKLDNFISKRDRDHKGQLYVAGIRPDATEQQIRQSFGKFGKVDAVSMNPNTKDRETSLRGTVTFQDKKHVNDVIYVGVTDPAICKLFLQKKGYVNVFLTKQERDEFRRATRRPMKPMGPSAPMPYNYMMGNFNQMPGYMPPQGMMFFPPMGMMPPMMPPKMAMRPGFDK